MYLAFVEVAKDNYQDTQEVVASAYKGSCSRGSNLTTNFSETAM